MMLPSGNDAAVALALEFGQALEKDKDRDRESSSTFEPKDNSTDP